MCLAEPLKSPSPHQNRSGGGGSGSKWRGFRFPVGAEKWRQMKRWGWSNLQGVEHTVQVVTELVLNLNLNFTFVSLPLLFAAFLAVLSPHRDIQAFVCGSVLTVVFLCLALNRQGWMDIPDGSTFRIGVRRLFRRTEKIRPLESDVFASTYTCRSFRLRTYKVLPLNQVSRVWGAAADTQLPPPFNYISVWLFATLMKCDRSEAEFESLSEYKTISQFFRRRLKPGLRPVCAVSSLVSPADGSLTYIGPVQGCYLEQVKGIRYCLKQFLGPLDVINEKSKDVAAWEESASDDDSREAVKGTAGRTAWDTASWDRLASDDESGFSSEDSSRKGTAVTRSAVSRAAWDDEVTVDEVGWRADRNNVKAAGKPVQLSVLDLNKTEQTGYYDSDGQITMISQKIELHRMLFNAGGTGLFQAVIYLSPSDYHRFHSPTSWTIYRRRHFPGKLYSVSPRMVCKMPGLFHTNERVALTGRWRHGFFSMTAVGATNVGSIVINFDAGLSTNLRGRQYSEREYEGGVQVEKGEEMGYFNFGSTIVLIFEAPLDYQFRKESVTRVRVGEGM